MFVSESRPSSTPTSTRSTPRSSSATTRAARPARDRRRRRGAGRELRGQGVRRAHRDGRPAGAAAVPGRDRRAAADVGLLRGEQGRVRGVRRHDAARRGRCRSTRRSSTCRGLRRIAGTPERDRRAAAARRARAGRAADHRRRRAHQVPREGGERRRQARRAARRAARPRARVPAPAAGRAALGRRRGDGREAARAAASRPSARSPRWPRTRWSRCSGAARAATCTRSRTTATRGRCSRGRRRALDRLAARARPPAAPPAELDAILVGARRPRHAAACATADRVGRTVVLRLRFDDFDARHPLAHAADADRADARRSSPSPAGCSPSRDAADRASAASRSSASRSRNLGDAGAVQLELPFEPDRLVALDAAVDDVRHVRHRLADTRRAARARPRPDRAAASRLNSCECT